MPDLSTTTLAALMSKRRKCLVQLRELALRQSQMIAAGETADLLRLISAKQQLIVAMQALEKELAPFGDEDPGLRVWASADVRLKCAQDADACRTLVQEVMAMEQEGERQMMVRRDAVEVQLRSVANAGRVRDAYMSQR